MSLSAIRRKMLDELDRRMPSVEGEIYQLPRINLFEGVRKMDRGTSCGLLPTVLMKYGLGVAGGMFRYGTRSVRDVGIEKGAWVWSDGNTWPKPGDIYTLRHRRRPSMRGVTHVGIIVEVDPKDGAVWRTGDAGQDSGGLMRANYCDRRMTIVKGYPCLSQRLGTQPTSRRRIGGWLDLDRLMENVAQARPPTVVFRRGTRPPSRSTTHSGHQG